MGELFVKYDPVSAESTEPLAKKVSDAFLGKPVVELVKYMANPAADESNPKGYNADDARRAQLILDGLNDALNNPSSFKYQIKADANDGSKIELNLDSMLSDYADRIVIKDTLEEEGNTLNYRVMKLKGAVIDVGGFY